MVHTDTLNLGLQLAYLSSEQKTHRWLPGAGAPQSLLFTNLTLTIVNGGLKHFNNSSLPSYANRALQQIKSRNESTTAATIFVHRRRRVIKLKPGRGFLKDRARVLQKAGTPHESPSPFVPHRVHHPGR